MDKTTQNKIFGMGARSLLGVAFGITLVGSVLGDVLGGALMLAGFILWLGSLSPLVADTKQKIDGYSINWAIFVAFFVVRLVLSS